LRETERDPFEDVADEEEDEPQQSSSVSPKPKPDSSPPQSAASKGSSYAFGSTFTKPTPLKKPKKDKKGSKKSRPFNLEEEKPKMKTAIAESSVAATNLLNALQLINREHEQVSDNATAVERFELCKTLRRHILRYVRPISNSLRHAC
jgi:LAS seventeen-binding protein 5